MKRRLCIFLAALLFLGAVFPMATAAEAEFTTEPMIETSGGHAVALRSDGTVWAWGSNSQGQLGDGTRIERRTPVQVQYLSRVTAVTAHNTWSLALRDDGTVWIWGGGFLEFDLTPVQVPDLSNIIALYDGIAIRDDGTLWSWSLDGAQQLGENISNVTAVARGDQHVVALRDDGTVWTWGLNNSGQLGDGTQINRSAPVQVQNLYNVTAIAAGRRHSVALREDGTVWAWGSNGLGQLGDGTETRHRTPSQVPNLFNITAIAIGWDHTIASENNGAVWAWGSNWHGVLGDGTTINRDIPTQVQNLSNITSISADRWLTMTLRDDGTVWAWGINHGMLGIGWTNTTHHTPVQVLGPGGVGHLSLTEDTPFAFIFSDVPRTHWARSAVAFVYEQGLMQGTAASTFAPNATLTRAMVVTILHRLAGEPTVAGDPAFDDVPVGQWFSDAIAWASDQEIVTGTSSNLFAPNAPITREQFAAMLHRYAEAMDIDVTIPPDFAWSQFADYDTVSPWATDAMRWAVYNGLITGTDPTTLSPQGNTTRAQSATILMRFVEHTTN